MMSNPAIIVVAYNRPASLLRLLTSIANGNYLVKKIPLHISIDRSDVKEVGEIANDFDWEHGEKIVQISEDRLGLKNHILQCGELTESYGAIIMLEDDLLVSPNFYEYARKGLDFYSDEIKVAGISLYSYEVAESCGYPFSAIKDQSDVYFMQIASSWGQAWTNSQWSAFKIWRTENGDNKLHLLPAYIKKWGNHSWKKYFINYLIDTDRYFVFPQFSFSTNFEDRGTNASTVDLYQVELEHSHSSCVFSSFSDSRTIYDCYFEPERITLDQHTDELVSFDYTIDLYGQKPLAEIDTKYVLTTRSGSNPERRFSSQMHPLLKNVIFNVEGIGIQLFLKDDINKRSSNPAEFYSKSMVQNLRDQSGQFDSFSIVIPILELDEELLSITLSSLPLYDSRVQLILACNESIKIELAQLELVAIHQFRIVTSLSTNENDILIDGLDLAENEIITWCRQGSRIASDAISKVADIFGSFKQLYWLTGIESNIEEKNYHSINTASYRWNQSMMSQYSKRAMELDTEFTFWRRNVFERARRNHSEQIENIFAALMTEVELTIVCFEFGKSLISDRKQLVKKQIHQNFVKPSIAKKLFGRIAYYFFRKNIGLLRVVFVELEHLPPVLRYDFKNGTFYSNRY